jgi:hypothetical protein
MRISILSDIVSIFLEFEEQKFHNNLLSTENDNVISYYSIKPYSDPSGTTVYNSGALLPPPTMKFWNDSNLRSCTSLWTPHGTSLIHSSEGTSAALQSKKNSAVTALTMMIDFAPIPIISQ